MSKPDLHKIFRNARFDCRSVQLTEYAAPIPLHKLVAVYVVLPGVADISEDRDQRHNLRLIRQVVNSIDVLHVQELRSAHEAEQEQIAVEKHRKEIEDNALKLRDGARRKLRSRLLMRSWRSWATTATMRRNAAITSTTKTRKRHNRHRRPWSGHRDRRGA